MNTSRTPHAITRRRFVQSSAAVATGVSAGLLAISSHSRADRPGQVDIALFDERYSDSRRFAEALSADGAEAIAIGGDIGRLWYGQLHRRFVRPHALRLAGMTPHSDLLLMQGLAAEQGARLLFQACHDGRGTALLAHRIYAPRDRIAAADLINGDWHTAVARLASFASNSASHETPVLAQTVRASDHPGTLWSWSVG